MTDFFSLSPPRSVYTAISPTETWVLDNLWLLSIVNSAAMNFACEPLWLGFPFSGYMLGTATVGSDASSVFNAFRNLQALSVLPPPYIPTVHRVPASHPLLPHTRTYLDPGPAKQHGSFTKPKPLSSLSSTSWKHKKRATLSAGRKEQEPASWPPVVSTRAALLLMLPFTPQSSWKIADSGHWGGDRPKVRSGSQRENLLWFLQAYPSQEPLSRKRRLIRVILELTTEFNGANFWNGNKGWWEIGKTMGKVTILQTFKCSE